MLLSRSVKALSIHFCFNAFFNQAIHLGFSNFEQLRKFTQEKSPDISLQICLDPCAVLPLVLPIPVSRGFDGFSKAALERKRDKEKDKGPSEREVVSADESDSDTGLIA